MEQSTAASRMSPAAGRAPAFRWALSARRRPGSDKEATVLACAVLDALGVPAEGSASLVSDLARATAYMLTHGSADAYRLTIEIDDGQCAVRVDEPPEDEEPGQRQGAGDAGAGRLCVHHRTDGSLEVCFRRPFPVVAELAPSGPEQEGSADVVPLPVVPLASGARGRPEVVTTDMAAEG
ncbi:hypothetical protein ABT381_28175 [Streptomyces sp. NPDC000151]|uniref:hypothetical protein n=1 Tax=Streptomyces sp. NPDC000151 TaxID=3154244 RepID=UPI003324D506